MSNSNTCEGDSIIAGSVSNINDESSRVVAAANNNNNNNTSNSNNNNRNENNKSIDAYVTFGSEDSSNDNDGTLLLPSSRVETESAKKRTRKKNKRKTKKSSNFLGSISSLVEEVDDEGNDTKVAAVLHDNDNDVDNSSTIEGNTDTNNNTITEPYPADTYSILALHGPIESRAFFSFGLMVYLFQITFLILMVLSVIHPDWSNIVDEDNPDAGRKVIFDYIANFVPSHASPLVRATQIMATLTYIIFADSTIHDVVLGVELFPSFNQARSNDKIGCMVFSSLLRLSQGILATTVTLFLIISTSNVIEIILNFTAINFISTLDNVGFEVIKWGKYGTKFKEEADRIEKLPLPKCINRKRKYIPYWSSVIPIGVILMAILCLIIILQENKNVWVTKIFRVQFQEKEQGLQVYNGCYVKNDDALRRNEGFRRKLYESFEDNSESAKFGYCNDDRRWILFKGDAKDACDAGKNDNELARSSKTETFDVSTMFEETWYSASNTPLALYFVEDNDDTKLNVTTSCPSFIDDGKCDPDFNTFDYQYDGGDCCAATCSGSNCGIGFIKNPFGTNDTSGDGFPNCVDPDMVPITIRLDNILNSREPQFIFSTFYRYQIPYGFDKSSTIDEILANQNLLTRDGVKYFTDKPVKPLLFIDCDGSTVLNIYVDKSMENQSETIMVNDGADCTVTIRNTTSTGSVISDSDPVWYVNYSILHGDKKSVETNSIVVAQSFSAEDTSSNFKRIPECYFSKLSDFIDNSTVYTGYSPTVKAIDWLMNDESENSSCEDSFFLERYALSVISFSAPSIRLSNYSWISKTRQCVWPSIICDVGTVIKLYLPGEELTGSIPSEIGLLTSLEYLGLTGNQLIGFIPSEIGHLTSLTTIGLDQNYLSGSIPSEIGSLTLLEELWLDNNELTGSIPSQIGLMISVENLSLGLNYLTGSIPSEIGLTTSVVRLELYRNGFTGVIPSEIGLLTSLEYLYLYENTFTSSIPSEIGMLPSLTVMNLNLNHFTGSIPSEIGMVSSLSILFLRSNDLIGSIPSEIGLLTSLESLSLRENGLTGIFPSEIGLMKSLALLHSYNNELTGSIPSEIGMLTSVTDLRLNENELTGSIPSEIGWLTSLEYLYLFNNSLTGSIPSEIEILNSLYHFGFDGNELTGSIPPSQSSCNVGSQISCAVTKPVGVFTCDSLTAVAETCPTGADILRASILYDGSAGPSAFLEITCDNSEYIAELVHAGQVIELNTLSSSICEATVYDSDPLMGGSEVWYSMLLIACPGPWTLGATIAPGFVLESYMSSFDNGITHDFNIASVEIEINYIVQNSGFVPLTISSGEIFSPFGTGPISGLPTNLAVRHQQILQTQVGNIQLSGQGGHTLSFSQILNGCDDSSNIVINL